MGWYSVHQDTPRDWCLYNKYMTQESRYFPRILHSLIHNAGLPPRGQGRGRPALPIEDMVFCGAIRAYYIEALRGTVSELWRFAEAGYLRSVPHFNSINNFLADPYSSSAIQMVLRESLRPLEHIETDFSVDSTGFGERNSETWMDVRFQRRASRRLYKKMHFVTGNLTNIIAAVIVTPGRQGDSPMFRPLAQKTGSVFVVEDFEGDSAYASRENCNIVASLGGHAFFWPKSNSTATAKGSPEWHRMNMMFNENLDLFKTHYHKRSNAESTISVVKWRFGDFVLSRNYVGQVNEILLKVLCSNVTTLIRSMFEVNVSLDSLLDPPSVHVTASQPPEQSLMAHSTNGLVAESVA